MTFLVPFTHWNTVVCLTIVIKLLPNSLIIWGDRFATFDSCVVQLESNVNRGSTIKCYTSPFKYIFIFQRNPFAGAFVILDKVPFWSMEVRCSFSFLPLYYLYLFAECIPLIIFFFSFRYCFRYSFSLWELEFMYTNMKSFSSFIYMHLPKFQVHYYIQSHIQINEYRDRVILVCIIITLCLSLLLIVKYCFDS